MYQKMLKTFLAVAASSMLGTAAASAAEKLNFRLDWTIYGTHAPFFLALEQGLYTKEGLDVSISEGQGVTMQMQLVAQGSDPIGFIDLPSTMRGIEQGMPLKAVAGVMNSIFVIISKADNPIKTPKELPGKIIAMAPAESSAQLLPALLNAQGVEADKVSILSPAVGAKNALFLQGRADAIPAAINVQVAQLEAQGSKIHYFKFGDYGAQVINHGIVVNTNYLATKADAVRGFLRASRVGFEMARKDPGMAVDAIIKRMPEQARHRDVLIRQLVLSYDAMETPNNKGKPFGWMAEQDWTSTADLLTKYGGLTRKQPLDRYYTNEFLPN
jgi:NitT/TauT family transport system substrate-binding protein